VSTAAITFAEVAEQVRALLAALAQAQDDGRTEDLVALYAQDGIVDVPGLGTFAGAGALREAFAGWAVATVARYHDTFRNDTGTWVLARRSMEFIG
jgi:SnoaL-like domain